MPTITNPSNDEPSKIEAGCYVDGHWGQYGASRVLRIADDMLGTHYYAEAFGALATLAQSADATERADALDCLPSEGSMTDELGGCETVSWAADEAEAALNDATTGGYWEWRDGEFFLSLPSLPYSVEAIAELNPYQLSNLADCASPDSPTSEGAQMLERVRDGVIELLNRANDDETDRDDINDDGSVSQIADDAPSVYTATMWAQFADLAAWQEDPTELGADASDMGKAAAVCLYMIADRLAHALIEEAADAE